MALTDPLTLNANAFTGVSLAVDHNIQKWLADGTLRTAPSLSGSTPQELDIRHTKVKRGKYTYIRSTIGLKRSGIVPTGGSSSDVPLEHSVRLTIDRPTDGTAVPVTAILKQWGELYSVFGVTLSTGGIPSTNVSKFLGQEP